MHARHLLGLFVSSLIGLATAGGCGGSELPPATAQNADEAALSLYLEPSAQKHVDAAVQAAFVAGGYTMVSSAAAPHDVTLRTTTTAAVEQSMFQVQVNGVAKVNLRVTVALTAVLADGRVIDHATTQYVTGTDEPPNAEQMRPLVQSLRSSGRLAQAAGGLRETKQADARKERQAAADADRAKAAAEEAARTQRHIDDEASWQAASTSTCAAAASLTACATLETWLKGHPASEHAQEAKQTLDIALPKVVALGDAMAWDKANAPACKAPAKSSDCDGVKSYLATFPTGAHADEARAMRDAAWTKTEALRKQETASAEAKQAREEALAEAEAKREIQQQKADEMKACRENCTSKEGFCGVHRDPQKFQRCAGLCLQRRCKQ
jgi:hypothetical protein